MTGGGARRSVLLFCPNCGRWVTFTVAGNSPPFALQCSCGAVYAFDPGPQRFSPRRPDRTRRAAGHDCGSSTARPRPRPARRTAGTGGH
jgi:hypothetical protein